MDALESSTRHEIPDERIFLALVGAVSASLGNAGQIHLQTSRSNGRNASLPDSGTIKHLMGATAGGSDNTRRSASCSRAQYECSSREYKIRPIPNDGSITFGVNSREASLKTRRSILMKSGVRTYFSPSAACTSDSLGWASDQLPHVRTMQAGSPLLLELAANAVQPLLIKR